MDCKVRAGSSPAFSTKGLSFIKLNPFFVIFTYMKSILSILLFIIFHNSIAQELRFHLLDSNLNEVVLRNPNKISNTERLKIHNYVEYSVDIDSKVTNISYYYAQGKIPTYDKWSNNTTTNKYGRISFSKPENREGILRSRGSIVPYKFVQGVRFREADHSTLNFKKYWPNGQFWRESRQGKDGKLLDGETLIYYSNGNLYESFNTINGLNVGKFIRNGNGWKFIGNFESGIRKSLRLDYNSGAYNIYSLDEEGDVIDNKTKSFNSIGIEIYNSSNGWTESSIKNFFDNQETRGLLEGIFTVKHPKTDRSYKLAVLSNSDGNYYGRQLSGFMYNVDAWESGEVRCEFEETAVDGFYNLTWYDDYKKQEVSEIVEAKAGGSIMTFADYSMIRLYPKVGSSNNSPISRSTETTESWKGNGSGIIFTKDGYIATNYHVIEDASEIEVEFKYEREIKTFRAEVVRTDPTNDLAIIKINDPAFNNLKSLLYNFKTRRSQIGESVFALGFPKALSIMGKDMKFTDGKISSLTGFMGDVTVYQTSTPIQPGNSGGPLFDTKGNLIAINSAKIVADDVDNVSYSIKSIYLLTLIDALPREIELPSSSYLNQKPLTEQIKILERYVTLIKVK